LISIPFSKTILKKGGAFFRVVLIRRSIENSFIVKKVANLPTFYHQRREEVEYYDPDPSKWSLEEKIIKDKKSEIYKEIQPDDTLKSEVKDYKVGAERLPTKLLKIPKEGGLRIVKSREESEKISAYAILSYN